MTKLLVSMFVALSAAVLAIATGVFAAENEPQPHQENPFAGKVVFVWENDAKIAIEDPKFASIHGRTTLYGRKMLVIGKSIFSDDYDVTEPWSYRRSNATVYIAWDDVTVCESFDSSVFKLSEAK